MRNNKLFFLVMLSFGLNYGMEQPSIPYTTICVKKESIEKSDRFVDIVVACLRDQQRFKQGFRLVDKKGYVIDTVGAVQFMKRNASYVNIMKSEKDTDSQEETEHHPYEIVECIDSFYEKKMKSRVLVVVEPKMKNMGCYNRTEDYLYKRGQDVFYGHEAITAAESDLALCYNNILERGLQKLGNKKNKSIAIPTLSTSVGFPREDAATIALTTIASFIKKNPHAYSRIELFVQKRFEQDRYRYAFLSHRSFSRAKSAQNDESIGERKQLKKTFSL